jgi:hypothetical protein
VWSLKDRVDRHEADEYRHLDKRFPYEHGQPVGTWDLKARDEQAARAFEALQKQTNANTAAWESLRQTLENRKPRWRPQ